MTLPVKHSVAVVISKENQILAIRRLESDDELPGVWGLPAGTCRDRETAADVVVRIGRDKLGVRLLPIRKIASGSQIRATYRLEMELWGASMDGQPKYGEWQWASVKILRAGAAAGSLCCELGLKNKSRVSR